MKNRVIFIVVFVAYSFGVFVLALTTHEILWGVVMAGFAGLISWLISAAYVNQMKRFNYEMEQIAKGNIDVEIVTVSDVDLQPLVGHLEQIRQHIKTMEVHYQEKSERHTKELTKKITDLEKLQDVSTDSVLLAKKMQQERDQLLIQLQQMRDSRKRYDHKG